METVLRTPTGVHYDWLKQNENKTASFSLSVNTKLHIYITRFKPQNKAPKVTQNH